MNDFIYYVISGFVLMILPVAFIGGVWLRGFFMPYIKVKASAGKRVLVKIRTILRDYYAVGEIIDGSLKFKSANKNSRTLILPTDKPTIYKSFNVNCIDVDEEKNCIYTLDAKGVSGYDAEKYDDLILRALLKPALHSQMLKIIVVLIVLIIIGIIAVGAMQYQTYQVVTLLNSAKVGTVGAFA